MNLFGNSNEYLIYIHIATVFTGNVPLLYHVQLLSFILPCVYFVSKMSKFSQDSSNKSGNSIKKVQSEMLVSNISPKVEVELTPYYQSRRGHICNLTKYISRLSVIIERPKPVSSIKKIEEKIEYTLFKINQLTEQICLLLLDNEPEKQKTHELCTKHMNRGSKAFNKSHAYTQNDLEKLHFTYERVNLNYPFQQMNEPYSQTLVPPVRAVSSKGSRSSKSKSSSGSSNASRKELV